jgi:hypothetical protein
MSQYPAAQAEIPFREDETIPSRDIGIREQLEATTRAVGAAHDAHVREALESVEWERRGLLGRLARRPAAA